MFLAKSTSRNHSIPKTTGSILMAALISLSFVLSACGKKTEETTEDTRHTESIAQVGEVPEEFREIIAEDRFRNVSVSSDRLVKVGSIWSKDGDSKKSAVIIMDLYGEVLASHMVEYNAAYDMSAVTLTKDGGFIFAFGYNDHYIPGRDQLETGYHSRIIKCDAEGQVLFDKKLESVKIGALGKCIEKDGVYYFFGENESKEILANYAREDIYILAIDEQGNEVNQRYIGGSSFDRVDNVEKTEDGFVLKAESQSNNGDFVRSGDKYKSFSWRIVISDDLEIMEKEIVPDGFDHDFRRYVGVKDGEPLYDDDEMFSDFDGGWVRNYIDYGDTYLIVSERITGQVEHQPAYVSSIWYYSETVYSMYDKSGTLIFRASVDSSPDYEKYANDEWPMQINEKNGEN
ncbi:MAG: hypothetical protein IKZ74_09165, partial [Clostridiales bacterium]|nr:hypothetical protein [Clostridiales bacterium]